MWPSGVTHSSGGQEAHAESRSIFTGYTLRDLEDEVVRGNAVLGSTSNIVVLSTMNRTNDPISDLVSDDSSAYSDYGANDIASDD
jgi:hypothetical protein